MLDFSIKIQAGQVLDVPISYTDAKRPSRGESSRRCSMNVARSCEDEHRVCTRPLYCVNPTSYLCNVNSPRPIVRRFLSHSPLQK
jgi:hypothetical protein